MNNLFLNGDPKSHQLAPGLGPNDVAVVANVVGSLPGSSGRTNLENRLIIANAMATTARLYPNGDLTQMPNTNNQEADILAAQEAVTATQNAPIDTTLLKTLIDAIQRSMDASRSSTTISHAVDLFIRHRSCASVFAGWQRAQFIRQRLVLC